MKMVNRILEEHLLLDPKVDVIEKLARYGIVRVIIDFPPLNAEGSFDGPNMITWSFTPRCGDEINMNIDHDVLIIKESPGKQPSFDVIPRVRYEDLYEDVKE